MKLFMSLIVLVCFADVASAGFTPQLNASPAAPAPRNICGWIDNPTPANYWITDAAGLWVISAMGGYQAEGDVASQNDDNQVIYTNGNYGSWCGCVKATTTDSRKNGRRIVKIVSSKVLPLSKCLNDSSIKTTFRPKTLIHSMGKAYTTCLQPEYEEQVVFRGRYVCVNEANEYYNLAL